MPYCRVTFRLLLLQRIQDCINLNREYQKCFQKTKDKLKENPQERQFEFRSAQTPCFSVFVLFCVASVGNFSHNANNTSCFSENYIFGKFDTFCKRLEKIADMINTMELWAGILDVRIEGIEAIVVRYKSVCEAAKKKTYDILDHRKSDFDTDYSEFKTQFENLHYQVQNFLDVWFERNLSVCVA